MAIQKTPEILEVPLVEPKGTVTSVFFRAVRGVGNLRSLLIKMQTEGGSAKAHTSEAGARADTDHFDVTVTRLDLFHATPVRETRERIGGVMDASSMDSR